MSNTFPEIDAFCAKYGDEQGLYFLSLYYTYCSCVGEVLYVFNNDRFISQFNERFLDRLISKEGKEFSSQWLKAIDPYSKNQDSKIHNEMRNSPNIIYIPGYLFMTEFFIGGKQLSADEQERFELIKNEHNNQLVNPIAGQSDNDEITSLAGFLKKYGEKKGELFLKLFYSSQTSMNALRHSGLKESTIEEYSHYFYNKVVDEFGNQFATEWIKAIDSFMNYSPQGLLAELYCDSDSYIDKKYVDYAVSFARSLNADESNLLHLFDGVGKDLILFNHIDALKKAILSYNKDKSDESVLLFTNALRAVLNFHDRVVTLHSVRNDGTIRIDYRIQRGFPYLSCYTSEDEIKAPPVGFDNMEVGDFCSILPTLFKKKSIRGIIFNPETDALVMDKEYLLKIMLHQHLEIQESRDVGEKKWTAGIPDYTPNDLISEDDLRTYSIVNAMEYLKKDGYRIVSANDNALACPNIIMEKNGDYAFVCVKGYCDSNPPGIDEFTFHHISKLSKHYGVTSYFLSVAFSPADKDRAAKRLLLKGDYIYLSYNGLQNIESIHPFTPQDTKNWGEEAKPNDDTIKTEVKKDTTTNSITDSLEQKLTSIAKSHRLLAGWYNEILHDANNGELKWRYYRENTMIYFFGRSIDDYEVLDLSTIPHSNVFSDNQKKIINLYLDAGDDPLAAIASASIIEAENNTHKFLERIEKQKAPYSMDVLCGTEVFLHKFSI